MTVKELIDFLSRENPNAKVTLTNCELHEDTDSDGNIEAFYDDVVTELKPYHLSVDAFGNGDVDIRWL